VSHNPYVHKVDSLCPVALRMHQTHLHAPSHQTWGVVTCDICGEQFVLSFNRIHLTWTNAEDCAKLFEALLAEDHFNKRAHSDSYDIPD
jgi:phage terminase large subunit GpA-like protein